MDQQQLLELMTVFTGVAAVALTISMIAMVVVAVAVVKIKGRTNVFLDRFEPLADTAESALQQASKQSTEILENVRTISETSKKQIDKIDKLVDEFEVSARTQIDRVDKTTEAVQTTILGPVKQIRGIAAAIAAILSYLGPRKSRSSVDQATLDEEMFI